MRFSIVPFLLLAVPVLEIATFILVGERIGVLATLALVFITAVIGSVLLRVQGFGLLSRIQGEMDQGRVPGRELVHGVMILIAGVLLLVPGFITDAIGFLLFIPALRDFGWRFARDRVAVTRFDGRGAGFRAQRDSRTIDLESENYTAEPREDSPWRGDDPKPGSRRD